MRLLLTLLLCLASSLAHAQSGSETGSCSTGVISAINLNAPPTCRTVTISDLGLTASNGGIIYSTASALAVLAGTATAGQIVRSGASSAPSWSTATYPATVTSGRFLLATSANVIGDGPAPVANATRNVECTTPGNVSSFTTTNGLITAVTTC